MTTHIELSEDAFAALFRPKANHLNVNATCDWGNGFGTLYETYGAELDYVKGYPAAHIWTWVEGDDGAHIVSGFHFVNRIGYFLCEVAVPDGVFIEVELETVDIRDLPLLARPSTRTGIPSQVFVRIEYTHVPNPAQGQLVGATSNRRTAFVTQELLFCDSNAIRPLTRVVSWNLSFLFRRVKRGRRRTLPHNAHIGTSWFKSRTPALHYFLCEVPVPDGVFIEVELETVDIRDLPLLDLPPPLPQAVITAMDRGVTYLWHDEQRHCGESTGSLGAASHIFHSLRLMRDWLDTYHAIPR